MAAHEPLRHEAGDMISACCETIGGQSPLSGVALKQTEGVHIAIADEHPGENDEVETRRKRAIICRRCGHSVTTREAMTQVSGAHRHVCTNPAGITFIIGCFSFAPGCLSAGEPTPEFTWFPGFNWSYALCGGCFTHLGWRYESKQAGFFGLILDTIAEYE